MIVPQTRLLVWFGVVTTSCALLGAVLPESAWVWTLVVAGWLLVGLMDALTGLRALDGIEVDLPAMARFTQGRAGALEVRFKNLRPGARPLQVGLAFPAEIRPDAEVRSVVLPGDLEWSRAEWRCLPLRRGRYLLERVHLEGASRLGLWAVRASPAARCEIRVYPNLFAERRDMAALFLNRGLFGVHARRQVGKGREFEKLREYIPGDGFEDIHWKATARRGRPITKVFQVEKTQEVYVVLDASRLSARAIPSASRNGHLETVPGPAGTPAETPDRDPASTVLERFITAGLVLGLAAERQGDLFGVVTCTDRVERFLRARTGKAHYGACRDALYTLESRRVTPDFDEIAAFLRMRLRRRALLVFLTSLDDPVLAESFVRQIDLLCRQHLVLVNMLQPPGTAPLFSEEAVMSVDDLYQRLGGHLRWRNLRELGKVLERRGVKFSLLANERLSARLVSQYLEVKQRQML